MGVCSSKSEELRILMLGLDGAGKTSLLYQIRLGEIITTAPTIGFNVETVKTTGNTNFTVWDIGGQERLRPLWRHYTNNTDGLFYVVDSTDMERMSKAGEELIKILENEGLNGVPIVIIANKQDLPSAHSPKQISELLHLNELSYDRMWQIQGVSAITSEGVVDSFLMMETLIKGSKRYARRAN